MDRPQLYAITALTGLPSKFIPPQTATAGITLAGLDLGQLTESTATALLGQTLATKLTPYIGLTGSAARVARCQFVITLDDHEKETCFRLAIDDLRTRLVHEWDSDVATRVTFDELPADCQTLLIAMSFKYGPLADTLTAFWIMMTSGQWCTAMNYLENKVDLSVPGEVMLLSNFVNNSLQKPTAHLSASEQWHLTNGFASADFHDLMDSEFDYYADDEEHYY